jgi:uncharacterized protein (DUF433 family)
MSLADTLVARPPPLRLDESGTLRVGKTRVPIDTVVRAYENGASPEEIVLGYDTLQLADVHAVISYYLEHREEVEAYLERRRQHAKEVRARFEAHFPTSDIRKRLLARQKAQG